MNVRLRILGCGVASIVTLAIALAGGARIDAAGAEGATTMMVGGFGGAVLVGDGEIFVAEPNSQFRPGTVYVYRKTTSGWQQAATIAGPDSTVGDRFGTSLAIDGARLFVGGGNSAIHVFAKQGSNWTLANSISLSSVPGAPDAMAFGTAVASSGDWLFVGKEMAGGRGRQAFAGAAGGGRGNAAAAPQPAGAVFAFKRGANGQYEYQSTIVSADAAASAGDSFGSAIAAAGNVALIGAIGQSNRAGVVHEFAIDPDGTWKSQRTFAPIGAHGNEQFGAAIALNGDQAVVSAPGDAGGYGAVYVFRKVAQQPGRRGGIPAGATPPPAASAGQAAAGNFTWQAVSRLSAPAAMTTDRFGTSLAADDQSVWVGAPGAATAGRIFVFSGNATGFKIDGLNLLGPMRDEAAAAGQSISLRGSVAAVGASGVNRNLGGLLIYERDGSGVWKEQPMLSPALDELPTVTGGEKRCSGQGKVEMFECGAADLQSFLPPSKLTHDGHYIPMSSLWGWTDSTTKHEWAIMGRRDGATFVDITNPAKPLVVADMPLTDGARPSSWREIKVYKDHAYVVSDAAGPHGIQVFDLARLRTMIPEANGLPKLVEPDTIYREVNSVHDIVINEESGFMFAVGSSAGGNTCGGGLHIVDIHEPKKPTFVACYADVQTGRGRTGYTHDAQCVTYHGPDKRYKSHEICVGSNETAISLADVTDKKNIKFVSRSSYPNVGYTHQGWFDEQHKYFYVDDETDEGKNGIDKTRTLIWDFTDLENPKLVKEHFGVTAASDHNLYIKGELMYQADYRAGLRVLSIKDRVNPKEVAYFDTAPYGPNTAGFNGAWNVFPFFKSGSIIVSSIEQGLFVIRMADR